MNALGIFARKGSDCQPMNTKSAPARYRVIRLLVCTLVLLAGVTLMASPAHALGGCASGSTPCIEFQVNYRNPDGTTFMGGPAGTHVNVVGGGFGAVNGQKISLGVVKGEDIWDSNPNPALCAHAHVNVGASAVVGATGTPGMFAASFYWPTGTSVGNWSVCAYLYGTNTPAAGGNTDSMAFDVTSPYRPTVSVWPTTVAPGGSVTVTGKGWLPPENTIVVYIASCEGCTPIARYGNAASNSGGAFGVPLKIPANAKLGKYLVWADSLAIPVSTSSSGPHLTVGYTTVTPTPTPKPPQSTATATSAATSTSISTAVVSTNSTPTPEVGLAAAGNGETGNGGGIGFVLGLSGIVALAVALGGAFYVLRRRRATAISTFNGVQTSGLDNPEEPDLPTL
jgi:hypothetical protein